VEVPYLLSKYDPDALRKPVPLFRKLDERESPSESHHTDVDNVNIMA